MIKVSKRIEAICSLIPINSKVIDIGCDHGLLDIFLYQNKISNQIIASDINENALNMAKKNIEKNKLQDKIELRLGNGLDVLTEKDKVNTIVITGLGAHTIIEILKKNFLKLNQVDNIIIGSNTKLEYLRKEVTKMNYIIEDEIIIEDNQKIYTIIKFKKGNKKYTKKELYFGPILLEKRNEIFEKNTRKELEKLKTIKTKLPKRKLFDKLKVIREIKLYKKII